MRGIGDNLLRLILRVALSAGDFGGVSNGLELASGFEGDSIGKSGGGWVEPRCAAKRDWMSSRADFLRSVVVAATTGFTASGSGVAGSGSISGTDF